MEVRSFNMDTTELDHCKKLYETESAIQFEIDGDKHWIPMSQIIEIHEHPGLPVYCDIEIPVWLYEKMF